MSRRKGSVPVNKIVWTDDMISFLKENFFNMTNRQLAQSLKLRLTATRIKCYELGLLRMEMEYWTPEQVDFLKENYQTIGDTELATLFTELWAKKKGWTKKHIEKKRRYLNLKRTAQQKRAIKIRNTDNGMFSVNHYKRWQGRVAKVNEVRVWLTSQNKLGKFVKTEKGFIPYAPVVWEMHNGPIPKGHVIRFIDGNNLNCNIENLKLITRKEHAQLNTCVASQGLSDNYVAGVMSHRDKELRKLIKQNPEIIQLKREQLLLNRHINKQQNEST